MLPVAVAYGSHPRQKKNAGRPRIFLLSATVLMYTASGTHWGLNCYTVMREFRDPEAWAALPMETVFRWSLIATIMLFFTVRADYLCLDVWFI